MRIRTSTMALGALVISLALFVAAPMAQEKAKTDEKKKKEGEAKPEKKDEAKKEAKKEELTFASREKLLAHFEAEREVLTTKVEVERRKTKPDAKKLNELHKGYRKIDTNALKALEKYITGHPKAKDLSAARYDIADMAYRLGDWPKASSAAQQFINLHGAENADLKRQASYLRASALLNIEGKEKDAVKALENVANAFPGFLESDLARRDLLRAYQLADDVKEAKKLIKNILKLEAVQDDPDSFEWAKEQRHILESVGKKVAAANFSKPDDAVTTMAELAKPAKPMILWYWDSRDGLSLRMLKRIGDLAKTYDDKIAFHAISVNKSAKVWKQFIKSEKASKVNHLFEGRVDSPKLSSRQLGVDRFPLALLVNADRTIHRFDTPSRDLERTIKAWLAATTKKAK